ncbi:molecular chaperone TorD family protein [Haloarchaeobius sp. HRN-SO-5]|uniref:molecular chaperone TorD family protein n=1 Tax=Haloarchaeobius sp. HRN-SO-5 TaxID=3446118 RepID=UPI003EBA407A
MASHDPDGAASPAERERLAGAIDVEAGARGAVYALVARTFTEPDERLYRALDAGDVADELTDLLERTGLDVAPPDLSVADDHETLSARYNDLFVVGYSEVVDKTDGTVDNYAPPVSLYETDYRPEVSWNDVNLDLARAYEHFGCQVDQEVRRNHDHVRLQLEFVGYLCRREAAVDPVVARARLDFHDRHLRVVTSGVADALESEPGTGLYGELASFLDRFTAADVDDLDARLNGEGAP